MPTKILTTLGASVMHWLKCNLGVEVYECFLFPLSTIACLDSLVVWHHMRVLHVIEASCKLVTCEQPGNDTHWHMANVFFPMQFQYLSVSMSVAVSVANVRNELCYYIWNLVYHNTSSVTHHYLFQVFILEMLYTCFCGMGVGTLSKLLSDHCCNVT